MGYYVGCDLGGTNMRAAIVDSETGDVIGLQSTPTLAHEGHDKVLDRIALFIEKIIADAGFKKSDILGLSVGLPGSMNTKTGTTIYMTNLPDHWIDVPVGDILTKKLGIPTFILNDVRAITWGELRHGAGKGCQSMACFALGTGIGGGVVVNGELVMGNSGQAGELGHMIVEPHGNRCNCRSYGCLETYASGPAIRSAALKAVAHGSTTILGELVGYDLNKITPKVVSDAANQGDAVAKEIYEKAGYYLGIAVSNVMLTLEPQKIVITGGVAAAGDLLFDPVKRCVAERAFAANPENIEIVPGILGDNAGIIGNSMWAEHMVNKK